MSRTRLAIFVVAFAGLGAQCRDGHDRHLQEGARALADGRFQEAAAHYAAATRANTRSAAAFFNLGYALYRQDEFERAGHAFASAVAHSSGDERARGLYNLGNALAKQGRLGDALSAYRSALRLDPGDDDARHNYVLVERWLEQTTDRGGAAPAPLTPAEADRLLDKVLSGLRPVESTTPRSQRDW